MELNTYQKLAGRTSQKGTKTDTELLVNAGLGLSGEGGEVNDILKKYLYQHYDFDITHFKEELGDTLWYIALFCTSLNIELSEIANSNIKNLETKYHGNTFDSESFTSMKRYQELATRTIQKDNMIKRDFLIYAGLGLASKSGEVNDIIKKNLFQTHDLNLFMLKEKLGDTLWYLTMFCTSLNIDLTEIADINIKKLEARYPAGYFEAEKSVNREKYKKYRLTH